MIAVAGFSTPVMVTISNWAVGYLVVTVAMTLVIVPKAEPLTGAGVGVMVRVAEIVPVGESSRVGVGVGVA